MRPFRFRYGLAALFLLAGMGQAFGIQAISTAQYIEQLQGYESQVAELASRATESGCLSRFPS